MKIAKFLAATLAMLFVLSGTPSSGLLLMSQAQFQIFLPVIIKSPYEPEKGGIVILPDQLNDPNAHNCDDLTLLNEGWYYNNDRYVYSGPGCFSGDRRFVPRLYDTDHVTNQTYLDQAITSAVASGWLLGFVEPNLSWQGNVTPYEGAVAWKTLEDRIAARGLTLGVDIKLVAPAPNQWEKGECRDCKPGETNEWGYEWIEEMVRQYQTLYNKNPHFDAMGWNYYYDFKILGAPRTEFANYLTARRQAALNLGLTGDIWVIEYGGACWNTGTTNPTYAHYVMDDVTPWLKSTPWIKRYAWFGNRLQNYKLENTADCSLLTSTGGLTSLGSKYRGY
jgi:hypothetical protein